MSNSNRVLNIDEISAMSDDELGRRLSSLSGYLGRERNRGNRRDDLEVEYCYLYREAEIRTDRRTAHMGWLNSGGHLQNFDQEYAN
jgi:hypothetical protein